jgi:hypothetical protein
VRKEAEQRIATKNAKNAKKNFRSVDVLAELNGREKVIIEV